MSEAKKQKPTVGRAVHYYPDDESVAEENPTHATITSTRGGVSGHGVSLTLMPAPGAFNGRQLVQCEDVPESDAPAVGHWTWPPRS
jgi:hypothetical protein